MVDETSRRGAQAFRQAMADAGASALGAPARMESLPGSRALWDGRVAPLIPLLHGVKNLIVIPSGAMLGIPLETLTNGAGELLGDLYSVSYSPSATVYAWLREQASGARAEGKRALLVGDPPLSARDLKEMNGSGPGPALAAMDATRLQYPGWSSQALRGVPDSLALLPRLIWSRREIMDLAAIFPASDLLLGPAASEPTVVKLADSGALAQFNVIHLATHALVDDARPERSAIVLSLVDLPDPTAAALEGRRIFDGLVTAKEIVREWKLNADLVTLSACETALGKEVAGEGYVGLAQALLQVGARSVLVSLWGVNDRATSLLMHRFYQNWIGQRRDSGGDSPGMSKGEALREAKQWLRQYRDETGKTPFAHQFYWAPFILIGDAS